MARECGTDRRTAREAEGPSGGNHRRLPAPAGPGPCPPPLCTSESNGRYPWSPLASRETGPRSRRFRGCPPTGRLEGLGGAMSVRPAALGNWGRQEPLASLTPAGAGGYLSLSERRPTPRTTPERRACGATTQVSLREPHGGDRPANLVAAGSGRVFRCLPRIVRSVVHANPRAPAPGRTHAINPHRTCRWLDWRCTFWRRRSAGRWTRPLARSSTTVDSSP